MHLHGNTGVLQRNVVSKRVVYIIYVVILVLQQKCWRRPGSHRDFWELMRRHGELMRRQRYLFT